MYLCICISVFAYQTPRNIVFKVVLPLPFHEYHVLGLSDHLTQTVFVYLCICICVFGCQTLGNIVFEVFEENLPEVVVGEPE